MNTLQSLGPQFKKCFQRSMQWPLQTPWNFIPQIGDLLVHSSTGREDIALLVCELKPMVTKAHIRRSSDRYMGSVLSRWWAPFLPGPERMNCEEALCEEEGSSCRQLNWRSVGSPLDTVIACLLKAGQWGLSLAEEFHSTRQHTHTHWNQCSNPETQNSAALVRTEVDAGEAGGNGTEHKKLVQHFTD